MTTAKHADDAYDQAVRLAKKLYPDPGGRTSAAQDAVRCDLQRQCIISMLPQLMVAGALVELSEAIRSNQE